MIQVTLRIVAPPEKRDEVIRTFRTLLGPTRVQRGCIRCGLYQDVEQENGLSYIEQWETRADLETHLRSDQFWRLLTLIDLSTEPPEIEFSLISETLGMEYLAAVRGAEL
jgi:quinol monooxygenase YgiN